MKLKSKYVSEVLVRALMILSIVAVVAFVISILYIIFHKGIQSITWAMITQLPQGGFFISGEGGFLNAIVGSLYIVLAATVLGLLISVPIVVYLNIYLKKDSRLGYFCRLTFDVLYGIPSIVYGAFAFIIMIAVGMKPSLLAGDNPHHGSQHGRGGTRVSAPSARCNLLDGCHTLGGYARSAAANHARVDHGYTALCRPSHRRHCSRHVHGRLL